jgi:hypothetical protein
MDNRELLRTLSGCKFYQEYLEAQQPVEPLSRKPEKVLAPPKWGGKRRKRRLYRKYCLLLGALLLGLVALVILPLWLVYPPYGEAFLLSVPPMLLCALSWMSGAWWAWDKDRYVFLAVTLGATPARLFLALGWAWLVLTIPGVPCFVFALGLMWHWLVFTAAEVAMMHELGRHVPVKRTRADRQAADGAVAPSEPPRCRG